MEDDWNDSKDNGFVNHGCSGYTNVMAVVVAVMMLVMVVMLVILIWILVN